MLGRSGFTSEEDDTASISSWPQGDVEESNSSVQSETGAAGAAMGKAARWLRSFLGAGGKKDAKRDGRATTHAEAPLPNPKEKIRWSFRRPVVLPAAEQQDAGAGAGAGASRPRQAPESETVVFDQKKHAVTAAADMAAATVVRLSSRSKAPPASIILAEAAAAVRIQATFRGYLARTALCALRGIVKLQAVVRGQLVRKQAKATLRCMQALLAAQSQLRAQRLRFLQIQDPDQPPPRPRQHPRHRRPSYETDMRSCEENAKAVETDYSGGGAKGDRHRQCSPAPSSGMTTELSPTRASSWHLEASSSPQSQNVSAGTEQPSYMGNTESSRAKVRSQSAPRQRAMAMDAHALLERQPSGRRKGAEHRSVPRGARMQRSSSQQQQQHCGSGSSSSFFRPWSSSVKLDSSSASLRDRDRDRDSECGSTTSSVLTAATTVYSRTRSLVGLEVRRGLY